MRKFSLYVANLAAQLIPSLIQGIAAIGVLDLNADIREARLGKTFNVV